MTRAVDVIAQEWADYNEGKDSFTPSGKPFTRSYRRIKNVAYDGRDFYSYSTVVARYYEGVTGEKFVLCAINTWGPTTAAHISAAKMKSHEVKNFTVPSLYSVPDDSGHSRNIAHLQVELKDRVDRAIRGYRAADKTSWYGDGDSYDGWRHIVRQWYDQIMDYMHLTGEVGHQEPWDVLERRIASTREAKYVEFYHPRAVANRKRAAARRLAKEALGIE